MLLQHMPADPGAAFVVLQHQNPSHDPHLAEILDQADELPAIMVKAGMPVEANKVYVLSSGFRLEIASNRRLHLTANRALQARPTLIDQVLRSLASSALGPQSVGIILSGTGQRWRIGPQGHAQCRRTGHGSEADPGRLRRHATMPLSNMHHRIVYWLLQP